MIAGEEKRVVEIDPFRGAGEKASQQFLKNCRTMQQQSFEAVLTRARKSAALWFERDGVVSYSQSFCRLGGQAKRIFLPRTRED